MANYGYDAGSQLTAITYTQGGAVLGDLAYTYDSGGRRATVGGSLAHTNLPQVLSSASYNSANQMTQFGTAQLTYDLNGNLTSDGTHTYTWDSRNHLVAIDHGNTGSFDYDPFGRRMSKSVYGITTSYLYDGANVAQELSGNTPSANLLSGGLDEVFTRTDSSGSLSFLRDGLGSTSALMDSTGTFQDQYTYDPYGNTSTTGNASSNSYEYIGRETDAAGLYYFRNRYYSPYTQRFASQDPMGLMGGPNVYEYASDNPTTYRDPNGQFIGCLIGIEMYEFGQAMRGMAGRKMNSGWNDAKGAANACVAGLFGEGLGEVAAAGIGAAAGAFADALEGMPAAADAEEAAIATPKAPNIEWPPDHGFAPGTREGATLDPGTTIDRYGNPNGDMTAPAGTPFEERALPSSYAEAPLTTFEVVQPFQVTQGLTAPWFGQPGVGIQYEMPFNTLDMVEMGFLKILP